MYIDSEWFNVDWCNVEVYVEIEEFKGHREPGMEVGEQLDVWVEISDVLFGLWKLDLAKSPVPGALDVPCESSLPVSDERGPRERFIVCVDVAV